MGMGLFDAPATSSTARLKKARASSAKSTPGRLVTCFAPHSAAYPSPADRRARWSLSSLRMIEGALREIFSVREDVGGNRPRSLSFFSVGAPRGAPFKLARWPQVRAILKEADVDAFNAEHGNEVERWRGAAGKGKIGTGWLGFITVSLWSSSRLYRERTVGPVIANLSGVFSMAAHATPVFVGGLRSGSRRLRATRLGHSGRGDGASSADSLG